MTRATGIGSMPWAGSPDNAGASAAGTAYAETVRLVLGEVPDLPFVPELPGRGAVASMTGRTLGLIGELGADLQPAGWRLTDAPGIDQRRARSLLAQDLDVVEELTQGYAGPLKTQVAGPWTLAATVERPRGDKVLADHGARRDLADALAEGLRDHVADLRRRFAGPVLVQVDEPALPAVLAGRVPTASGFGRHRSVDAAGASPALEAVLGAVTAAGATPLVHCCAADVPVGLLLGAGAQGLSVDLDVLAAAAYDELAELLEGGLTLLLGVVPTRQPPTVPGERSVAERVERFLDMLGLDPDVTGERLVLTPSCGTAGADPAWARAALGLCRRAAAGLTGLTG